MDLKLGHYSEDSIEGVDVEGEIDIYTVPRLRELLSNLASKNNCQLIVNMDKVEFLDSTGLGVLVGGLKRVRAHDGSLDLVCTQERILKIFRITELTKVFGIHQQWTRPSRPRRGAGKEHVTGGEVAEGFGVSSTTERTRQWPRPCRSRPGSRWTQPGRQPGRSSRWPAPKRWPCRRRPPSRWPHCCGR